jgi:lysophospholipase L1-like esterase
MVSPSSSGVNVQLRRVLATTAVASAALTATIAATVTASGATWAPGIKPLAVNSLPVRYVALGDSYSAGTGAGPYTAAGRSCERSANAFPQLWAARNSPTSFVSVACSGATTATVQGSQLSALTGQTTLVSITVGGNDVGFSHVMETCVLEWDSACLNAVASAESAISKTLPGRLDGTLKAIRARAPLARIVVLGYPDLYDLSRSPACIGIGTTKRTALNQGADDLDRALAAAAARNGDVFADVRTEFAGHQVCDGSADWLNALTYPLANSYHPNASGQKYGYLPAFTAAQP